MSPMLLFSYSVIKKKKTYKSIKIHHEVLILGSTF